MLLWDRVGPPYPQVRTGGTNAQYRPRAAPVAKQICLLQQAASIGTRIMAGHRMIGMAKECFAIFGGNARRSQSTGERMAKAMDAN